MKYKKALEDIEVIKNYIQLHSKEKQIPGNLLLFWGLTPLVIYFIIKYLLYNVIANHLVTGITISLVLITILALIEYYHLLNRKNRDFSIVKNRFLWTYFFSDLLMGFSTVLIAYTFYKLNRINYIAPALLMMIGIYCLLLSFLVDKLYITGFFILILSGPAVVLLFNDTLLPSLVIWAILALLGVFAKEYSQATPELKQMNLQDIKIKILLNTRNMVLPSAVSLYWSIIILFAYFLFKDILFSMPIEYKFLIIIFLIVAGEYMEKIWCYKRIKQELFELSKHLFISIYFLGLTMFAIMGFIIFIFFQINGADYIIPLISHLFAIMIFIFAMVLLNDLIIISIILFVISSISFFILNYATEINVFSYSLLFLVYSLLSYQKERKIYK